MPFQFSVPIPTGEVTFTVKPGSSAIFVGANGGGKTRLAVHIENSVGLVAHRISAHRALTLNPSVAKINERQAKAGLKTGYAQGVGDHRSGHRWHGQEAVALLNDFDFLVQALFADQANKSLETHQRNRAGNRAPAPPTKFERLVEIWQRLLPHRHLRITGDDIEVVLPASGASYGAAEMSDGERAIFYMIGQALAADDNSLLIIDEPELHVHRSIMSKLWDEIEAARADCGFAFITHDLEFAAARVAQKFIIREYEPAPRWSIEQVPDDTGFSEEITTLILGSRRPVLFVEGDDNSLDASLYRCCFPDWTVIPRGSCEEVIHAVVTMRRNASLTRVTCSGIVDADDFERDEIERLGTLGVAVLCVSEIENVILLPNVSRAIAAHEGYEGPDLEERLRGLKAEIFDTLATDDAIEAVVMRYCRRRIDRVLKKMDFSDMKTVDALGAEYAQRTSQLDIAAIAHLARERIRRAIADGDLPLLLAHYDNKQLMALAAMRLKNARVRDFESWLGRILRNSSVPELVTAIRACLPMLRAE